MKLNNQPIEKIARNDGLALEVHSIFATIQGEGPFCGVPCVFIRLAGCNLQCPFCDTEYTEGRVRMSVSEILHDVLTVSPQGSGLVVITGGEPFRQNLTRLLDRLITNEFYVQIETNGTLPPSDYKYSVKTENKTGAYIVCSPKAGKVNPHTAAAACCFKYVLAHDSVLEEDGLPLKALGHTANPYVARPPVGYDRPIYVQPMDSQDADENARNIRAALESCLHFGYTLQIQIHKIVGVE